jgi:hypothetical protein
MVWHVVLFYALFVTAFFYAIVWGGSPERIIAMMMTVAFLASMRVETPYPNGFRNVEVGLFLVDLAFFAALYLLSLFSLRFWPIWMSAMQGAMVLSHAVKFAPPPTNFGYAVLEQFWTFPMLTLLIVATRRHRQRLARNGTDPSWIVSFARSGPSSPR